MLNNDERATNLSSLPSYREHSDPVFHLSPAGSSGVSRMFFQLTLLPISRLYLSSMFFRSALSNCVTSLQQQRSSDEAQDGNHMPSTQLYSTGASPDYGSMVSLERSIGEVQYHATSLPYDLIRDDRIKLLPTRNTGRDPVSSSLEDRTTCAETQAFTNLASHHSSPGMTYKTPASQIKIPQPLDQSRAENSLFTPHQGFLPVPPMPPSFSTSSHLTNQTAQVDYTNTLGSRPPFDSRSSLGAQNATYMKPKIIDANANLGPVPVFGGYGFGHYSNDTDDGFTEWLFNPNPHNGTTPNDARQDPVSSEYTSCSDEFGNLQYSNFGSNDELANWRCTQPVPSQDRMTMTIPHILDPPTPGTILSEAKRIELLNLIDNNFNETDHSPVKRQKGDLLKGALDAENHVLSLKSMKLYIGSYWYHFHPQMPILHQPTFSSDKAQNLLLIAVITIGASCLDKLHGPDITDAGAKLSDFLAWHLRGEIFKDADFAPPAKLWVFQSLLLLEIYEKMYSTRVLHERAHIFHGTTLTLMRRGSSLIGRSALDSPPTVNGQRLEKPSSSNLHDFKGITPEQWWNQWITNEATRRVAFAAFIIDSIHATMFGHAATMVAHEMKLQLPCDEAAWSATSSAEVGRIENNLFASDIKPISFFDGLKLTLSDKPVRTNPFGRTALMAGLLSVSWHMNQRDVQVRSLGALKNLGGKDIWRGTLTRAFNTWQNDFDQNVGKDPSFTTNPFQASNKLQKDIISESMVVLHHLAHMAMHVDIVSCQIFAKAPLLLGRTTLPSDYAIARKRIRENWAPSTSARHATFYALKFLALVLTPATDQPGCGCEAVDSGQVMEYSAKDDYLLNRPWVLYFAALTVWSYGYALDESLRHIPELATPEHQKRDMRLFLKRVGGVASPSNLEHVSDRNACLGLLYVLRDMFAECRWQLIVEAAESMTRCINMLRGDM